MEALLQISPRASASPVSFQLVLFGINAGHSFFDIFPPQSSLLHSLPPVLERLLFRCSQTTPPFGQCPEISHFLSHNLPLLPDALSNQHYSLSWGVVRAVLSEPLYFRLCCLCVNWIFSSAWDYFVDWDLGYAWPSRIGVQGLASPGFPPLLRPNLLFPPWTYYLVAMANLLMRATWIVRVYAATVYPEDHPILRLLESSSGVLLVQAVEVVRRFVWLALRMEAVHTLQRTSTEYTKILLTPTKD